MGIRKSIAWSAIVALAFAFAVTPAFAQQNPGGDTPGNPLVMEDGSYCFDKAAGNVAITCTVLYGHIFNLLDAVPINTQFPSDKCRDLARGFTTVPTVSVGGGGFDQAKMDLYSSPGFVEYDAGVVKEDGTCDPRLHPERGITDDVRIDTSIPIVFYWYLSADTDDVSILADPDAVDTGAMPCVKVTVTLQTGRYYGQGTEIAKGSATRTMVNSKVAPAQASPVPDPCAAGDLVPTTIDVGQVTEFPIVLGTAKGDIPKVEAFVIHVEWEQVNNGANKFAQREWNIHTGQSWRSRLVLPVMNPVRIEEVRPQLFEDKIYIHGVFNSPWGSYDVDPASLLVEILKPDGTVLESPALGEPILQFSVDHDAHFRPVNATFPWEYKKNTLEPGTYKVRLSALNWQHTASASSEATIEFPSNFAKQPRGIKITSSEGILQRNIVGKGVRGGPGGLDVQSDAKGAPGFESMLVLAALVGAAAVVATRRRGE